MATVEIGDEIVAMLPRLRSFALSLARRRDEADDLVQGACERAFAAIDSWQPGTRLDAWMFRILRNLWIDRHRRRRDETSLDDDEAGFQVAGEDGRHTVEVRSTMAAVRVAIDRLPDEQREVLMLVCVEDLSYRDAAEVLEVPIGTVMSRLSRARRSLAVALEQPAAQPEDRSAGGRP
jgi:RNA polymerase sigma-70 factor (ECF subfamily)